MNYYNPYFMNYPTSTSSPGLLRSLLGGSSLNWSSILSNTQKVIGIANQAIPTIKQITPVMKNAKTMFRVMNEFKKVDPSPANESASFSNPTNIENAEVVTSQENSISYTNGPQFFL